MLSILTAVSSLTVIYPKVVLLIQTVVYILTVVSSFCNCSQQHHSPHSYFHVIFISAYPAVQVRMYACKYAWQKRFNWKGKQSLQACNYVKGRNHCRNKANDSFGRVMSHEPPEAHVIKYARGGAVELYGQSFSCYFSELGSIFKKALLLKPLNSRLLCFDARLER